MAPPLTCASGDSLTSRQGQLSACKSRPQIAPTHRADWPDTGLGLGQREVGWGGRWRRSAGANEAYDLMWADEHFGDDEVLEEVEILFDNAAAARPETPKDRLEDCMRNTLRGVQAPVREAEHGHRGVLLPQIRAVVQHCLRRCASEAWTDHYDNAIPADGFSLYDVSSRVLAPATYTRQCSYVELVAPAGTCAQTPKWFVSHWWGEPVMDFIACGEEHARGRGLEPEEAV